MISGPLSMRLVGEFLGKTEGAMKLLITQEGLPVARVNTDRKPVERVYFNPLLAWLNQRAVNMAWTPDMLDAELDRCVKKIAERDAAKKLRTGVKEGALA